MYLKLIYVLPYLLRLCLTSGVFLSGFQTDILFNFYHPSKDVSHL
jgi:hypothetical protein